MKTTKILAAAALALLAAAGAQAETYDGVHPLTTLNNRGAVQAEAVAAAHSPDPYADGYGADVAPVLTASADRAEVRSEAVAAAHAPNQNLWVEAFEDSMVPAQYASARPVSRQASR
jgi:hypothetical protein